MVEETRAAEVSRKEQLFYYSEHLLLILLHLQDEHTGSFSPTWTAIFNVMGTPQIEKKNKKQKTNTTNWQKNNKWVREIQDNHYIAAPSLTPL